MRDEVADWVIAKTLCGASHKAIWDDYSPSSDPSIILKFIEKYKIEIAYFEKLDEPWRAGVCSTITDNEHIAYGMTPGIAVARVVVKVIGGDSGNEV